MNAGILPDMGRPGKDAQPPASGPLSWLRKAAEVAFNTVSVAWYARNGYSRLYALLGGGSSSSGQSVTEATALNVSAVWRGVRVISDPVGFLPLQLFERDGEDRKLARGHRLYRLLHDAPNPRMTAVQFRQVLQSHLLLHGNAYSQIIRRSGTEEIIGFRPIHPDRVIVRRDEEYPAYELANGTAKPEKIKAKNIWHIPGLGDDGYTGYSVIGLARESIGLSLAADQYGGKFFAAGGRVPYILKHPKTFQNEQQFEEFRDKWNKAYNTVDGTHAVPMLTGGLEYQQIGMKPEDAQFLATRQFQIPEIARWFNCSPHKLGDHSKLSFANVEHLAIEFLTETLAFWLKLWEQSIWLNLLDEDDKEKYYAEFNVDAILRGDAVSQATAMSTQIQNGLLTPNEGRRFYNRSKISGGDVNIVQLNMQSLPGQPELSSQKSKTGVPDSGTQTR